MYTCEPAKDGAKLMSNKSQLGKPIDVQDASKIVWASYTGLHIGGQVWETQKRSYHLKPVRYAIEAINISRK